MASKSKGGGGRGGRVGGGGTATKAETYAKRDAELKAQYIAFREKRDKAQVEANRVSQGSRKAGASGRLASYWSSRMSDIIALKKENDSDYAAGRGIYAGLK